MAGLVNGSGPAPRASATLARRPEEIAAAQDMNMQMIDGLAAVGLAVDHEPRAIFGAVIVLCQFLGPEKHPSQQGRIGSVQFHNTGNVLFGNYKEMNRRLGVYIMEGQEFLILV